MKENEYVIINKTQILKRIEELASRIYENSNVGNMLKEVDKLLIQELKQILSQSTDFISEIEKAFDAGNAYCVGSHELFEQTYSNKENYIANLKLDI